MSEEMAQNALKTLAANYKRQFPKEGIRAIWRDLSEQPDKAIELAVDSICLNNTFLPSPAQLLEKVKTEAKKIATEQSKQREREWHEKKGGATRKELDRAGSIFTTEQSDRHAKMAVEAIKLMLSDASKKDKLDCFREMDKNFPGADWALKGMRLQKWWDGYRDPPHQYTER